MQCTFHVRVFRLHRQSARLLSMMPSFELFLDHANLLLRSYITCKLDNFRLCCKRRLYASWNRWLSCLLIIVWTDSLKCFKMIIVKNLIGCCNLFKRSMDLFQENLVITPGLFLWRFYCFIALLLHCVPPMLCTWDCLTNLKNRGLLRFCSIDV